MAGIGLNPSGCCCGGSLCIVLTATCGSDPNNYSVSVNDHATGALVASGVTAGGSVCFSGLPAGNYDVTAVKSGCRSVAWTNQTVSSGQTTLTGNALCANSSITFVVIACGRAVVGAVVSVSGADSGTVTTGTDGKATFYTASTGSLNYTASHPSGRYTTFSGPVFRTNCSPTQQNVFLSPASGYVCCATVDLPVKDTLYLTLGDGTYTVNLPGSTLLTTHANVSPVYVTDCYGVVPLKFRVDLSCDSANGFWVSILWTEIRNYGVCPTSAAYVPYGKSLVGSTGKSCSGYGMPSSRSLPLYVSGTVGAPGPTPSLGDPTGTTTWTLTE